MMRNTLAGLALAAAAVGCGEGGSGADASVPHLVNDGLYQLTTFTVAGDCLTKEVISPGDEYLGKVIPVRLMTSGAGVAVQVCDFPEEGPGCTDAGSSFDFGMARSGNSVMGRFPLWSIPGCGCTSFDGSARFTGEVTGPDAIDLTWDLSITAPDPECMCAGYTVCTGTVEQRLAR